MKFIILVSNLKEISHSVFSLKKKIYKKKLRCNSVKIRFSRKKRYINYAYVLKNGVGRFNIFFFYFYTNVAKSNEGNMSLFDFLSPVKNSMFTSRLFIFSWIWSYDHWWPTQWPHSVKRLFRKQNRHEVHYFSL
jgi:hypothetical protein